MKNYAVA